MKQGSTTPVSANHARGLVTKSLLVSSAVMMLMAGPLGVLQKPAEARDFDAEIRAVQRQIDNYQAKASKLDKEARTLETELARISNEKATLQAQISLNEKKYKQLVEQIEETEDDIATNKDALGEIVANMYVDGQASPLEMIASSKNLGDFIDKAAYQKSMQERLASTIDEIKELKKKLDKKKIDSERVLNDQKSQRAALASKEAEQAELVSETRGKEAAFQKLSKASKARKDQIQREQQAAIEAAMRRAGGGVNAVPGDPGKGGYPSNLANSNYYSPVVDPWGMYSRQCVSYTAWKVYQKNGYMPYWGGHGNANQWPGNARAAGIPVKTTPRAGSVGVVMAGQYGHVVWVESVNSNGTINISQYNYYNAGGAGWGHYSEMYNVSPHAYDYYIYF